MKRKRVVVVIGGLLFNCLPCTLAFQQSLMMMGSRRPTTTTTTTATTTTTTKHAEKKNIDMMPTSTTTTTTTATPLASGSRKDFLAKGLGIASIVAASSIPLLRQESAADVGFASDILWSPFREGFSDFPLSDDLSFPPQFVAYLSRFLLHYDRSCEIFYQDSVKQLGNSEQAKWSSFATLASSVEYGLHRYVGRKGMQTLLDALKNRYATNHDSFRQLALLFSLLPAEVQPVMQIKQLLKDSADDLKYVTDPKIAARDNAVSDDFVTDPTVLLPFSSVPFLDQKEKAFRVPSLASHYADLQTREIMFGPLVSKERRLTSKDFALFAACGALGCSVTHSAVIPLDVVKTRLQTSPGRYNGLMQGVATIVKEEGPMMLMQGSGATLAGYFWYGITVYPGYEFFKRLFVAAAGPALAEAVRVPLVLFAGACATILACFGVCPAEAIRIRQVAEPQIGGLFQAGGRIIADDGVGKLYEGFAPLVVRQVSFGMMKFFIFDFFSETVFRIYPFLADNTSSQLTVSLVSGLVAGICSAIVSQPADTVLSAMNKKQGKSSILGTASGIINEYGPAGLFLGLGGRCLWSGMIISGQFLIYDLTKNLLHVSAADLKVVLDVLGSTIGTQ